MARSDMELSQRQAFATCVGKIAWSLAEPDGTRYNCANIFTLHSEGETLGSKLLLTYNILLHRQEAYLRFIVVEFIPTLQTLGLTTEGVWHTAYGDYPMRLLVFVSETPEAMQRALETETWNEMEKKLETFVADYARRVVPNQPFFQF